MDIFDQIATDRVVPVIVIENADDALPLADALIEGGLPVAEITVRTEAAIEAIHLIAKHRPDVLVGAGTVLTEDQVHTVQGAGAAFALAPGIDRLVLSEAHKVGLPFVPGVMTPSDIQTALRAGCRRVKFFPAAASGGLDMLKSLAAPYRHTGLRFNPTGGITPETMDDWLNHDFFLPSEEAGSPAHPIFQSIGGIRSQQRPRRQVRLLRDKRVARDRLTANGCWISNMRTTKAGWRLYGAGSRRAI